MLPPESIARPFGLCSALDVASPRSPAKLIAPVPAIFLISITAFLFGYVNSLMYVVGYKLGALEEGCEVGRVACCCTSASDDGMDDDDDDNEDDISLV
jgi:hypothetical protein